MTAAKQGSPWDSAHHAVFSAANANAAAVRYALYDAAWLPAQYAVYGGVLGEILSDYETPAQAARRELGFNFDTGDCND